MNTEGDKTIDFDQITPAGDDAVLPFAIEDLDTRGRAVKLGLALDGIVRRHDYPEPVARLLCEIVTLTVLLGTSLKFEGQFIVQTQTDGPVTLLVVDFRTPSDIRAHARFDEDRLTAAIEAGKTEPEHLLGKGVLAMTVDQGAYMQRYQGMVALEGNSLEEVAHSYFMQSEQIPTYVRLGVGELTEVDDRGKPVETWRAGGVLIQFMPESEDRIKHRDLHGGDGEDTRDPLDEDNAWIEAQSLFSTIKDHELTDPQISAEKLLYNLFHEQGLRIFDPQAINDKCSCSSEKIWSVLRAMSEEELQSVVTDGKIEVKCEFCCTDYTVTPAELAASKT